MVGKMGEFGGVSTRSWGAPPSAAGGKHERPEASCLGPFDCLPACPFPAAVQGGERRQWPITSDKRIFGICPHTPAMRCVAGKSSCRFLLLGNQNCGENSGTGAWNFLGFAVSGLLQILRAVAKLIWLGSFRLVLFNPHLLLVLPIPSFELARLSADPQQHGQRV